MRVECCSNRKHFPVINWLHWLWRNLIGPFSVISIISIIFTERRFMQSPFFFEGTLLAKVFYELFPRWTCKIFHLAPKVNFFLFSRLKYPIDLTCALLAVWLTIKIVFPHLISWIWRVTVVIKQNKVNCLIFYHFSFNTMNDCLQYITRKWQSVVLHFSWCSLG